MMGGRAHNTPVEELHSQVEWNKEGPSIVVRGKLREGRLLGENVVVSREIRC